MPQQTYHVEIKINEWKTKKIASNYITLKIQQKIEDRYEIKTDQEKRKGNCSAMGRYLNCEAHILVVRRPNVRDRKQTQNVGLLDFYIFHILYSWFCKLHILNFEGLERHRHRPQKQICQHVPLRRPRLAPPHSSHRGRTSSDGRNGGGGICALCGIVMNFQGVDCGVFFFWEKHFGFNSSGIYLFPNSSVILKQ